MAPYDIEANVKWIGAITKKETNLPEGRNYHTLAISAEDSKRWLETNPLSKRNIYLRKGFLLNKPIEEEILLYPRLKEKVEEVHVPDSVFGLLVRKVTNPSIVPFIPINGEKNKSAVIICPGGGYHTMLMEREGYKVAGEFAKNGVVAFVLKYRLPDEEIVRNKSFVPLSDAQRAIQLVRENAAKWNIDPAKIGIMGFSAGGHLAASLGVHYNSTLINNKDKISLKPGFMILINPVISFTDTIGHIGSRDNLLGKAPDSKLVEFFSNELHVNKETPKTILIHTDDDQVVPVKNSLFFYQQLNRNDVPAELHIYSRGDHGFLQIPEFEEWFDRCIRWMKIEKIIN